MICKRSWRGCGLVALIMTAGCARDYTLEDGRYGEAVRYTIAVQTADPHRGARGLDGEKAEASMRHYKEFEKIDRTQTTSINFFGGR